MPEIEQFPPGFRLVDGTHLNQLVDSANGIADGTGAVDAGSLAVAGTITAGVQVAAAAGSNSQANATPITKSRVVVATVSATTRAVKLPAAATGLEVFIFNAGATGVKVYPATGDSIVAGATNAVGTAIAKNKGNIYMARNASNWRVITGA